MKKLIPVLFLFLLVLPVSFAQDVNVSLYLLNLGKYDVGTGSFTADFYLQFQCDYDCSPKNFEFFNGRASSIDTIIDLPNEKFYRIQANLVSPPDLKRFPFDSQKMQIIIEDKVLPIDDLRYVAVLDQSGIEPSISFTGWNLDGWKSNVFEHHYGVYNETYSQYVFEVDVSRIVVNSFIKTFLPVIFILLVALSSFLLDPDKLATRIAMVSSGLIASVMFHISITNQIPPVGYLTFADKFMLVTYFVFLSSFLLNIAMFMLQGKQKLHHVKRLHVMTEYSVFIIVPIIYLVLFFLLSKNLV